MFLFVCIVKCDTIHIKLILVLLFFQVYFGSQHSRVYLLANLFGQNCATGMSWLIKKTVLEREGGLISFANYLAEDFFMGKALWERYVINL